MTFKQYQRDRNKIIRRNRKVLEHRENIVDKKYDEYLEATYPDHPDRQANEGKTIREACNG